MAADLSDRAAVTLGGAAARETFDARHQFSFFSGFASRLAALFGFAIERLRDGSRSSHFAEFENFNVKFAAVVLNAKHIAGLDVASGLGGLAVEIDPSEFAGARRDRACFEESRSPEPFVDAHASVSRSFQIAWHSEMRCLFC